MAETVAAGIAGARLVAVPDAPRLMNMERPAEFNRLVLDFLRDVYDATRSRGAQG